MMIITPKEKTNKEAKSKGRYVCPTCKAQTTDSKVEIGWVSCPMVKGKDICVGCCIDFQVIANSEEFENHPDFVEFLEVSDKQRKSPYNLRMICLNHQIELCKDFLEHKRQKVISDAEVKDFLNYLIALRSKIISN